jgi:hypothetical protein
MEKNLDINLIIESFQEKISQLMVELVVKEATIKQLSNEIKELKKPSWQSSSLQEEESQNTQNNNEQEQNKKPSKGMI